MMMILSFVCLMFDDNAPFKSFCFVFCFLVEFECSVFVRYAQTHISKIKFHSNFFPCFFLLCFVLVFILNEFFFLVKQKIIFLVFFSFSLHFFSHNQLTIKSNSYIYIYIQRMLLLLLLLLFSAIWNDESNQWTKWKWKWKFQICIQNQFVCLVIIIIINCLIIAFQLYLPIYRCYCCCCLLLLLLLLLASFSFIHTYTNI